MIEIWMQLRVCCVGYVVIIYIIAIFIEEWDINTLWSRIDATYVSVYQMPFDNTA
jgi:hypothetical protein